MADICLILEGTYPFVTGGVSSCIHQLIEKSPKLTFDILYLGANDSPFKKYKYKIPHNVENIREIYIFDNQLTAEPVELAINFDEKMIYQLLSKINNLDNFEVEFDYLYNTVFNPQTRLCSPYQFFNSKQLWDILEKIYKKSFDKADAASFVDFFYNFRFTTLPILKILTSDIPRAKLYHCLSTGYAGLLGSVAKLKYNSPLFLTEHGIYTHEREIEISQSEWIFDYNRDLKAEVNSSYFKTWWIKLFHALSKITYDKADIISTLYEGNKKKQLTYGADPEKIKILPNGIKVEDFSNSIKDYSISKEKMHIALVGRVVPIKDIKSFIKAIKIVHENNPKIEVSIIGPTEEDKYYYGECIDLINIMDLSEVISFTGKVNVKEWYPKIDLLVLSSISEGQPIVILEAFSCFLPVISTDVGSCRELIYGTDKLGKAGEVVPFGDSELLASAILKCINDKDTLKKMGDVAYTRVNKFFHEKVMLDNYHEVYNELIRGS